MTVIEIGLMGAIAGIDVMNEESQIITKAYNKVTTLPGGPHRAFWGLDLEDPMKVWAFFDFDSVEAHEAFAKREVAELVKDFPKILTHGEFMKHLALDAHSAKALQSPLAECVFLHFPADISGADMDLALGELQRILDNGFRSSPAITAVSVGWSVEKDFPVNHKGSGGPTGRALAAVIGWASVEAQEAFGETDGRKNAEREMASMDGMAKMTGFRVSCQYSVRKEE